MMKISKKSSPFSAGYWFEDEGGRAFRRVVGGITWPRGDSSGFVIVIGEDLNEDRDTGSRHLRILGEWREHMGLAFLEPTPILDCLSYLHREMLVRPFYGEIGPWGKVISQHNQQQARLRLPGVSIFPPPGDVDFEYHAGLVRRRVLYQKTLHFGPGIVAGKLGLLPADVSNMKHEDHPEIGALFFAVAGLDMLNPNLLDIATKKYRLADRAGGY